MSRHSRRVGAALAGAVLALTMTACGSSGSTQVSKSDALAQELATLANRGPRRTWFVTYAFTRTTNGGQKLHETLVAAHVAASGGRPALDISSGVGTLVVTSGTQSWSCTAVESGPPCLRSRASGTNQPGAVYGGAIVSGRYSIRRGTDTTIADFAARCFFLTRRHGDPIAGLGFSSEQCYSSTGIPLRSRVQSSGSLDERERDRGADDGRACRPAVDPHALRPAEPGSLTFLVGLAALAAPDASAAGRGRAARSARAAVGTAAPEMTRSAAGSGAHYAPRRHELTTRC